RGESRRMRPFAGSLLRLKRMQRESIKALGQLRETLATHPLESTAEITLAEAMRSASACERFLADRLEDIEQYDRRSLNLSNRLYDEALACRMRPFADGIQGFPRIVRDLAQELGKRVKIEITGDATKVARDI